MLNGLCGDDLPIRFQLQPERSGLALNVPVAPGSMRPQMIDCAAWGRANAVLHPRTVERLHDTFGVLVLSESDWGDGLVYIEIAAESLPRGYHGVQDVTLDDAGVRFQADADV